MHEFAHYVHYTYDKTLKSLDFIIDENDELTEELIKLTVDSINSKISRLNRYYNSPTELFARSMEAYILNREVFLKKAPNLAKHYNQSHLPLIENLEKILLQDC